MSWGLNSWTLNVKWFFQQYKYMISFSFLTLRWGKKLFCHKGLHKLATFQILFLLLPRSAFCFQWLPITSVLNTVLFWLLIMTSILGKHSQRSYAKCVLETFILWSPKYASLTLIPTADTKPSGEFEETSICHYYCMLPAFLGRFPKARSNLLAHCVSLSLEVT